MNENGAYKYKLTHKLTTLSYITMQKPIYFITVIVLDYSLKSLKLVG